MMVESALWSPNAERLLSDADMGRLLGVTPGYIPKLRQRGWLPKRAKVGYSGAAGGKGVPRYRFIDAVAAEVARTASSKFGWPDADLRRVVKLIRSGDEAAVRGAGIVCVRGELPGTVKVLFASPEEMAGEFGAEIERDFALPQGAPGKQCLDARPLIDIVEAIANELYPRMVAAGFEFTRERGN